MKNALYWRNRAIRAETELYALRRSLLQPKAGISTCRRILNTLLFFRKKN